MQDFAKRALDSALAAGASFAEARFEDREVQSVSVKNGVVDSLATRASQGFGIRVIADGSWGFAAGWSLAWAV